MKPRFIIDEHSLDLNGLAVTDGISAIQSLIDLIDQVESEGHEVCYDENLFIIPVIENCTLWDLCYPYSPIPLPPEVSERVVAAFGTMRRWYDTGTSEPLSFDVKIGGGPIETARSIAWAHQQAIEGNLASPACICISRRYNGVANVEVAGHAEELWFVATQHDVEAYFRWLLRRYAKTCDDIAELARSAFGQLRFVDKCFDGINKMSKPVPQILPTIVDHLSIFSDHGRRIFLGHRIRVQAEFGALGINISDENGRTKSNNRARSERRREVDGEQLYFWWHSKLEPHQDRIHICPDKVTLGGQIIVGIFCMHLTV